MTGRHFIIGCAILALGLAVAAWIHGSFGRYTIVPGTKIALDRLSGDMHRPKLDGK